MNLPPKLREPLAVLSNIREPGPLFPKGQDAVEQIGFHTELSTSSEKIKS